MPCDKAVARKKCLRGRTCLLCLCAYCSIALLQGYRYFYLLCTVMVIANWVLVLGGGGGGQLRIDCDGYRVHLVQVQGKRLPPPPPPAQLQLLSCHSTHSLLGAIVST